MVSKHPGDLYRTLSVMEQELQSTSQTLEQLALITGMDSLRVARAHLEKSIRVLTSSFAEVEYTKTEP